MDSNDRGTTFGSCCPVLDLFDRHHPGSGWIGESKLDPAQDPSLAFTCLGLTQVHPIVAIMIVGWLLALDFRKKHPSEGGWFSFNLTQVILVAWTIAALIGLYIAIQKGLLGIPNMQISGNGSSNTLLNWTQDRIDAAVPRPWILALPLFVFRILMLLWALWLAYSLMKWLRWGWRCFGEGGLWRKIVIRKVKEKEGKVSNENIP